MRNLRKTDSQTKTIFFPTTSMAATNNNNETTPPRPVHRICGNCQKKEEELGEGNNMLQCSVCRVAYYCNVECQKNDWQEHKVHCGNLGLMALAKAIEDGDTGTVQRLAKSKAVLKKKTIPFGSNGTWSAFHHCIRHGRDDYLELLLTTTAGINPNIRDTDGDTPLHSAADSSCDKAIETMKLLLEHGADVNAMGGEGWTPLMMASRKCNPNNVKFLLQHGADINVGHDMFGRGPLEMLTMMSGTSKRDDETWEDAEIRKQETINVLREHVAAAGIN